MAAPNTVNGRLAVGTLTYLGFALQLVQVGLIPLLPSIGRSLHASATATSWVLTSGLLSGAIFLAVLSRLADIIGKKTAILIAMALVVVGCTLCTFAENLPLLITGRVLIGAQLPMLALPEAVAGDTLPPARAHTAISAIHVGTGLGISGGLLLGALTGRQENGWHVYFAVGAVAGLIGLVATALTVRDSPLRAAGRLDVPGALLLAVALGAFLLGLSEGPTWGWSSAAVLALLVGGVAVGAVWWRYERSTRTPLIDVGYLTRPAVALPYLMTFLIAVGIYGSLSAVTRLAQTPSATGFGYGWSALAAGWFALPQALGSVAGIVVLRRLRPRGLVLTAAVGFAAICVGFLGFAAGHAVPLVELVALGFDAMGLAVTLAATQLLVLRAVAPAESGVALGLSVVMYAVGNSAGSAIAGVLFTSLTTPAGLPALASYLTGFAVCGACALLALLLCVPLARRTGAPRTGPTMEVSYP
ncbi:MULTISPECIES: MFS transporter [Streptomycetaceae]|uniref:MFS transporter n=1 Tax=Streptomycetaceae TaxID=2062 RepID=UPI00300810E5